MITVIAGVNGAGKSSIAGEMIRSAGEDYFNPDEQTRELIEKDLLPLSEANGKAWLMGVDNLQRAITHNLDYNFETTLGGNTITKLLHQAIDTGIEVRIFFCGLKTPELHIERVAARVQRGGHNIPEDKIRERWTGSLNNMVSLAPHCSALKVFDNSIPAGHDGPEPTCLFYFSKGVVVPPVAEPMPEWATPIYHAALNHSGMT